MRCNKMLFDSTMVDNYNLMAVLEASDVSAGKVDLKVSTFNAKDKVIFISQVRAIDGVDKTGGVKTTYANGVFTVESASFAEGDIVSVIGSFVTKHAV